MLFAILTGESPPGAQPRAVRPQPDLVDWLRTGRLTLLDEYQEPLTESEWAELPAARRAGALEDFHRVARGGTKAVVLSLRR